MSPPTSIKIIPHRHAQRSISQGFYSCQVDNIILHKSIGAVMALGWGIGAGMGRYMQKAVDVSAPPTVEADHNNEPVE